MSIKRVESLKSLQERRDLLNKDTLVIFDVGGVILMPESKILRHSAKDVREKLQADIFAGMAKQKVDQLWSRLLLQEKRGLVESIIPVLISDMQKHGTKVMALTSLYHGKFGFIPSMEDWRLTMLASHGIDFGRSFLEHGSFRLDELERKGHHPAPIFKNGVLFMHKYAKGEVLGAFLKRINYKPQTIIFVDDQVHNLESVAATAQSYWASYQGLLCVAEELQTGAIDLDLAVFQLRYLKEHEQWVGPNEASKLMVRC